QMPTVRDKIAQEAVRSVIAPILEKTFVDCSYAYRPGKGPQKAIRRGEHYLGLKQHWVADADIDRYFDTMDQRRTLEAGQKHTTQPEIVHLLALWMKMGAVDTRGRWVDPVRGVAQGSVISPPTKLQTFFFGSVITWIWVDPKHDIDFVTRDFDPLDQRPDEV